MARVLPPKAITVPETAERVFKGVIFDVYQWPQQLFDGSSATFEMLKRPDTVLMICIKDDKLIFIREEQPGRAEHVRLPGGRVDEGEDWDVAVRRECQEELGLKFDSWRLVEVHQPAAKIEWFVATYIAMDCSHEGPISLDSGERITLEPMAFEEAKLHAVSSADPLNDYTRALFESLNSLDELKALSAYTGKEVR